MDLIVSEYPVWRCVHTMHIGDGKLQVVLSIINMKYHCIIVSMSQPNDDTPSHRVTVSNFKQLAMEHDQFQA